MGWDDGGGKREKEGGQEGQEGEPVSKLSTSQGLKFWKGLDFFELSRSLLVPRYHRLDES